MKRLGLEPLLGTAVRQLSLGQRMRCDLAAALLHAPAIAFLDEPTIGLDLSVKEQVREYIRDMQKHFGTSLLITTHDLKDITEVCDRLLLLDKGKLLFDGSIKDFERRFANESRIVAELHQPATAQALKKIASEIKKHGGKIVSSEGHKLIVEYRKEGAAPALTQILLKTAKGRGLDPGKNGYRNHRDPDLPQAQRQRRKQFEPPRHQGHQERHN